MNIAAIVLAAGNSSRFGGGNKLLAEIGGKSLVRHVLEALSQSPVTVLALVTASEASDIVKAAGAGRWTYVINDNTSDGMSSSLRAGIASLPADVDGVLVALADMPYLSPPLIETLCTAFDVCRGQAIVFPEDANARPNARQGHPVIWPRSFFASLMALSGDSGGKSLLAANRDRCHPVPYSGADAFFDIDTADDLNSARTMSS